MNQFNPFSINNWVIIPLMVWVLFWKGFALWTAAKRDDKKWFVALLVLNTVGILEIIYLFFYAKKKWADVRALFIRSSQKTETKENSGNM